MSTIETRERILERMFTDMRRHGFQGLRADKVLADLGITKGALYHYFPNKQAIGIAVLDEILRPQYLRFYEALERSENHPVDDLQNHLDQLAGQATPHDISLGCPLNNLVQEMSPLDEAFRQRMKAIVEAIQRSIAGALRRGQDAGQVRAETDANAVGHFFFASLEGAYTVGKVRQDVAAFHATLQVLKHYLESLRT